MAERSLSEQAVILLWLTPARTASLTLLSGGKGVILIPHHFLHVIILCPNWVYLKLLASVKKGQGHNVANGAGGIITHCHFLRPDRCWERSVHRGLELRSQRCLRLPGHKTPVVASERDGKKKQNNKQHDIQMNVWHSLWDCVACPCNHQQENSWCCGYYDITVCNNILMEKCFLALWRFNMPHFNFCLFLFLPTTLRLHTGTHSCVPRPTRLAMWVQVRRRRGQRVHVRVSSSMSTYMSVFRELVLTQTQPCHCPPPSAVRMFEGRLIAWLALISAGSKHPAAGRPRPLRTAQTRGTRRGL